MTVLVVLGAGASYDSVRETDWSGPMHAQAPNYRPPLADELFAAAKRPDVMGAFSARYSGLKGHLAQIHSIVQGGGHLEERLEYLAGLADENDEIRAFLVRLRFYIRDVIRACNDNWLELAHGQTNIAALANAYRLLSQDDGEPVAYVTFN